MRNTIGTLITTPALAITLALVASPARGQSTAGAVASGSAAAVVDGGGTNVSTAGSLGYRLNRVIGLGVELTWMKLQMATPTSIASPYTSIAYSDASADAVFFTTNVRVEIPTTSRRILPYAIGGGGTAGTTNRYTVTTRTTFPPLTVVPVSPGTIITIPTPAPQVDSHAVSSSSTGLALNLGGGVSLLATEHVSVDVDLRAFYIRGNPSGSIGRFGIGASYRF